MKRLVDYLKENTFENVVGEYPVEIMLWQGQITLICDHDEYDITSNSPEYEIQDILYDNYNTEIRFCDECGKPYDAGYMAGDGEYYCCEDCFEPMMNRDYGEGKWKPLDEEWYRGGWYGYLDENGEWDDTGIFYTEWN